MNRTFMLLGLALVSAASAAAEGEQMMVEQPGPSYLGALAGYLKPDSDRIKNDRSAHGGSATGIWGYQWPSRFGLELNVAGDKVRDGGHRLSVVVDGYYGFGAHRVDSGFTPYLLAGAGIASNNLFGRNNRESFVANGGLGFVTPLSRSGAIRIRGDARYIYDDLGDGFDDFRISLGLEFPFFRTTAIEPAIERVEVTQPERIEVPVEVPVPVEPDPCPPPEVRQLRGTFFEFDSSRLRPNAVNILESVRETLAGCDTLRLEVAGHTDSTGPVAYNMRLSQERAQAVVDWFVQHGIDAARLTAQGYGPHEPVEPNNTADGRELNRRVELRIINGR